MPETTLLARLGNSPAADRVKDELEHYLAVRAACLLAGIGRALGRATLLLEAEDEPGPARPRGRHGSRRPS
ncbi:MULTISPECIES: hypothetical protein [Streptomyces]|uniref:hypothetical protein n=1 Tax=Streptomyces TaxID=1883 RepID=UPI000F6F7991|nr:MULTISPECIES: hypothetical protein [unclassified Streptomyces]AZM87232.1 hypothetical protein D1J60_00880 [Streptomyces sp. W1SF4]RSS57948.1 hypothetical protein EF912_12430 [Streptomyces sp. WAC07061]